MAARTRRRSVRAARRTPPHAGSPRPWLRPGSPLRSHARSRSCAALLSGRRRCRAAELGGQLVAKLLPGSVEGCYPLVLQALGYLVVLDADRLELAENLPRVVVVRANRVRDHLAMVGEGAQRGLGHGVDHVGCDEVADITGVAVSRILDRRRRPQRPLRASSRRLQRGPPWRGEHSFIVLIS